MADLLGSSGSLLAALAPIILLCIVFEGYCIWDISRSRVKWMPKWVWVVVTLLSVPTGGVVYLIAGRER